MMKKGIYIETKRVFGEEGEGLRHLYLVYRDGEGGERVIRGGPDEYKTAGKIVVEVDEPLPKSADKYGEDDTPQTRRARLLDLDGMDPEIVWRQMTAAAKQVAARGIDYDAAPMQNSNSTIRHVIEAAERVAPRPDRLKEDGIFGPKTADATAKALVRFGRRPVEAPILAEASQRAAPTRPKPEDDRPVFRA